MFAVAHGRTLITYRIVICAVPQLLLLLALGVGLSEVLGGPATLA